MTDRRRRRGKYERFRNVTYINCTTCTGKRRLRIRYRGIYSLGAYYCERCKSEATLSYVLVKKLPDKPSKFVCSGYAAYQEFINIDEPETMKTV